MLIDQFTEEQIAQIRRELREIQKLSKTSINYDISGQIEEIFDKKTYHDQCLFPYRAVTEAIGIIVDYTMDNFVYKKHRRSKKMIGWYRAQNIPMNKEEEYKEMAHEILDIIKKHKKQKQFSLKKPEK